MGKKLFIGNLPYSATDEVLQETFAQIGTVVSAKIVFDRESGRSKGFGFVEMSTDEEAGDAIERFHGVEFLGRPMTVSEAKPMAPRAGGFGGGGGGNRGPRPPREGGGHRG